MRPEKIKLKNRIVWLLTFVYTYLVNNKNIAEISNEIVETGEVKQHELS